MRRRARDGGPRRPLPPHVRRHSRMVFAMRLVLPALAAILLTALALWSKLGLDSERFTLALATIGPQKIESMNMENPHFEGLDEKKRPFSITAKTATQIDKKGDVIALVAPEADITLESGAWLTVNSETGQYQRAKQFLDLTGVVNIFHDQGFEMHTRDVHVDLTTNKATGDKPVAGQGPAGDLTAQGIEVDDGGKRVFLRGRSHLVLFASDQLSAAVPLP
jgi:lipopolysaccharide export system protein LptC